MQSFLAATLAVLVPLAASAPAESLAKRQVSSIVNGSPIGFASAATGGGSAEPVYPTTIEDLISYLESSEPQNIVIDGTFDFAGSEGTTTVDACNSYSCTPENGGQALLNTLDGCGDTATYSVEIDTAASRGIDVQSDKTLVGTNGATLNGKGLRFAGSSNIIVQNIAITNLNPGYVWGGDAFTFSNSDTIWIDHVTTSLLGRQHYVFGQDPSSSVTISNSFINGETTNSATCDGHTYWALELVGTDDTITFYKNHVYYTSGRTPALSGSTFFHAVNNVWSTNTGHLIEGDSDGMGVYEGNVFIDVPNVLGDSFSSGQIFTSDEADVDLCTTSMGRPCVPNVLTNSGAFSRSDTGLFSEFEGLTIVDAEDAASVQDAVVAEAGNTL